MPCEGCRKAAKRGLLDDHPRCEIRSFVFTGRHSSGNRMGWWSGDGLNIYVKSIGPGELMRLTTGGGFAPEWSPDGRWIAFLRALGTGMYAAVLIPPTGGAERTVTQVHVSAIGLEPSIAWSPDSHSLVVPDSPHPGGPVSLVIVELRNGNKRQLTFPPEGYRGDLSPAWSPDGRMIAVARYKDVKNCDLYLVPVKIDNTARDQARRLTFNGLQGGGLVWTPDGHEVIYASASGPRRLCGARPFPQREARTVGLHRSTVRRSGHFPAGTAVSFRARIPGSRPLASGTVRRAGWKRPPIQSDSPPPHWTRSLRRTHPTGNRVAFVSNRSGTREIWLSGHDGTGLTQLTSLGDAFWPQWSPDGRSIAFESRRIGPESDLSRFSHGGEVRPMKTSRFHDCSPTWSRDGKWIYFSSDRAGVGSTVEDGSDWRRAGSANAPGRPLGQGVAGRQSALLHEGSRNGDQPLENAAERWPGDSSSRLGLAPRV